MVVDWLALLGEILHVLVLREYVNVSVQILFRSIKHVQTNLSLIV